MERAQFSRYATATLLGAALSYLAERTGRALTVLLNKTGEKPHTRPDFLLDVSTLVVAAVATAKNWGKPVALTALLYAFTRGVKMIEYAEEYLRPPISKPERTQPTHIATLAPVTAEHLHEKHRESEEKQLAKKIVIELEY